MICMQRLSIHRFCVLLKLLALLALSALGAVTAVIAQPRPSATQAAASSNGSDAEKAAPLSRNAQRMYEASRSKLVKVRILPRGQTNQSSTGSGFFVSRDGLLMTNYHVVSDVALRPERFRAVYVTTEGKEGELELLAIDVLNDLAVARVKAAESAATAALEFRPTGKPLVQGERIYSLGNPLDIGFAVIEGNYNGLVERSFYPRLFFTGALNPGMSGGPALDEQGAVVGVNVAKRMDGEQASFLVPAHFAEALLDRARKAKPMTTTAYDEVTRQLMAHQQAFTDKFLATPLKAQIHGKYSVPVPEEKFMRCWGADGGRERKYLELSRTDCRMETRLFTGDGTTGNVSLRHEAYDGKRLGAWRFASQYSRSFANESFRSFRNRHITRPQCNESFVNANGVPMRAVLCMNAYKKFTGLYDAALLITSVDQSTAGVQGRIDAQGVSFENGIRLAQHYLQAYRAAP